MNRRALNAIFGVALMAQLPTFAAVSNKDADAKWKELHNDYSLSSKGHSYCYQEGDGEVFGTRVHDKVTIASVSKLVTSLWAVEKLGSDYQYKTKFYLKGKKLHIVGDLDPVFSKRKLFFLISQFHHLGIHELEEITFDKNVRVYTKAEDYIGSVLNVTTARSAANLKDFLNTPTWNKLKTAYAQFIKETPEDIIKDLQIVESVDELDLKVGKVYGSDKEIDPEAQGYIHLSPMIEKYMKYMNIKSNNYFADQIFDRLGGEKEFDKYFASIADEVNAGHEKIRVGYDKDEATVKMFTGSGLNTTRSGSRVDNFANCATVVGLVKRLNSQLDELGTTIQKVVAVPGTDGGTFSKRLNSRRLNKTIVAKTGTLYHTSALAGLIKMQGDDIAFGIFHQMTGWKGGAKIVQNKMVEYLWEGFEAGDKFEYTPEYFFPASEPISEYKD